MEPLWKEYKFVVKDGDSTIECMDLLDQVMLSYKDCDVEAVARWFAQRFACLHQLSN